LFNLYDHHVSYTYQVHLYVCPITKFITYLRSQHMMRALGCRKVTRGSCKSNAENLTDTAAELYANYAQWYKAIKGESTSHHRLALEL